MEMKVGAYFEFVCATMSSPIRLANVRRGSIRRNIQCKVGSSRPTRPAQNWSSRLETEGEVSSCWSQKATNVLFTVIHRPPDRGTIIESRPRRHMHLGVLFARMTARNRRQFWDGHSRPPKEYRARLPD